MLRAPERWRGQIELAGSDSHKVPPDATKLIVVRDRATTRDVLLRRLVTLPDVVLWRVLSYWRATE